MNIKCKQFISLSNILVRERKEEALESPKEEFNFQISNNIKIECSLYSVYSSNHDAACILNEIKMNVNCFTGESM